TVAEHLLMQCRIAIRLWANIERCTHLNQHGLIGTFQTLPSLVSQAQSLAWFVGGEAVALAAKLHWFGEQGATQQLDAAPSA
ncbi:uroporphyrinogen-III C-methyltransferase, partial [Vibrio cholerae]|nr:uroporphyrinogen-III C-methyltransferase [Vibrio cholerae]